MRRLIEGIVRALEFSRIACLQRLTHRSRRCLYLLLLRRINRIAHLRECSVHRAQHLLRLQLSFRPHALAHVVERMFERFGDHRFDGFIGHVDCAFDFNNFFRSRFHVARQDMKNPICIDLELHADAGHAFGRRLEFDLEFAQRPVVPRHLALALQHFDRDRPLLVHRGRKHFAGLDRNRRVARDDNVHQSTEGLDT